MPQHIKALSGSCVLIPCTFTIAERLESAMVEPARGIWMSSYNFRDIVFDSSKHYGENTLKAKLLGKVTNKNCTTIINHLKTSDSKSYFLRADPPKYTFRESVTLEVVDSPDRPAIRPSSAVKEGALTSLSCTAPAPCPREPPALVWSDTLDGSVEIEQVEQQDGTEAVSSVLTFTASHVHHNKDITCTAQYPVGSETKSAGEVSTLHVLYSPKNTVALISPPGEIHEGGHVTLSCSSNANPAVSRYTWFEVKGENINEKSAEQYLTFTDINPSDSGLYYCEARNEHGAENSTAVQLNVASPATPCIYVVMGTAAVQMLATILVFVFIMKRLMKSKSTSRPKREDTAELTEVNGLDLSSPQDEEENAIYANKTAATEDHQQGGQEENLHYASIDYSKLKPGNQESGTKRASQYSTEYSEVKRPGTAGSEREVTDPPIEENEYAEMKGCPAKNRQKTAAKSVSTGESEYAEVRRCHTSPE
ncbi:UNVERIFIED_CONTAM: hypothetical protein FKN15_057453 [Acipenser sinensis]